MQKSQAPNTAPSQATWWLRVASSSSYATPTTLHDREVARRSDLIAWIALAFLGGAVVLALTVWYDFQALVALLLVCAGIGAALVLNRRRRVTAAGVVLIIVTSLAVWSYILSDPLGLTLGQLGTYDVLLITVVLAASVLPGRATFVVAAVNAVCIVVDYLTQPHYRNIAQDAQLYSSPLQQTISILVRPIALNIVLAAIAYLWARGVQRAIQRAERAEEIVVLEHRETQRTFALEEGVRYLHQTLADWAVGDFRRPAPPMPLPVLEQLRADLNLLSQRFTGMANDSHYSRLLGQDASQLAYVLDAWASGQPYHMPNFHDPEWTRLIGLVERRFALQPLRETRPTQQAYARQNPWAPQGASEE